MYVEVCGGSLPVSNNGRLPTDMMTSLAQRPEIDLGLGHCKTLLFPALCCCFLPMVYLEFVHFGRQTGASHSVKRAVWCPWSDRLGLDQSDHAHFACPSSDRAYLGPGMIACYGLDKF